MRRERRRAAARREARDAARPSVPEKGKFFSIKVDDEVSPEELARRTIEEIGIEYEPRFTTPPPKGAKANSGPTGADAPCRNDAELAEAMADLDRLVGLKEVKEQIRGLVDLYRYNIARRNSGYRVQNFAPHLVFVGNPGTGKTTVARLIGRIYRALGLLKTGDVVDADRSRLVAGYTGQTAILTRKLCDRARGGILFIDEAYSLLEDRDSFGSEAVATLLVEMERLRGELVVIVAGYPKQMDAFIASNPGLRSRFDRRITFADYSSDELADIFESEVRAHDMELAPEARALLRDRLAAWPRGAHFGNGRDVRRLVETVMVAQARNWGESPAGTTALSTITAAAVEAAFDSMGKDLAATTTSHRIGYL
jgi:SpoVK/Ycf46/Vps4 family AAA+-type ATPase